MVVDTSENVVYIFINVSVDMTEVLKVSDISYVIYNTSESLYVSPHSENVKNGLKESISQLIDKVNEITTHELPGSEFVFVTFNSWDFKVSLIGAAKECGVELPIWIRFPKLYDLRKEYEKYLNDSSFESMNTVDSLIQVCNALDIKIDEESVDQSDLRDVLKLPSVLTSLYIKIFEALKKIPNKDILKIPYNYQLDYQQFIQEKSPVVYLSNLPPEIDVSEIKSWAFRLLQSISTHTVDKYNSDLGNKITFRSILSFDKFSGCGFMVFPKHHEALDFLQFNGVNLEGESSIDIIEVQPSSEHILAYASDILIPSLSTKAKFDSTFSNGDLVSHNSYSNINNINSNHNVRPGDWNCPSCGFSNFQRRTACLRCSFPVSSAIAVSNDDMNGNKMSYSMNTSLFAYKNNNHPASLSRSLDSLPLKENMMNKSNLSNSIYSLQNSGTNHNYSRSNSNNNNSNHNNNNGGSSYKYNQINSTGSSNGGNGKHGYIPFRAGDWKCENCSYHNFAKNIYCLRCGISRVNNNIGTNSKLVSAASSMILPGMNSFSNGFLAGPSIGNSNNTCKSYNITSGHQNGNYSANGNNGSNFSGAVSHLHAQTYGTQSTTKPDMDNSTINSQRVDEILSWSMNQLQVSK